MFRARRAVAVPAESNETAAIEQAWRIHAALADWTGKVDAKASFALAIESITIATIISLSGDGRRLSHLKSVPASVMLWSGVLIISVAILLAVAVVTPQLRTRQTVKNWSNDFIYFGHLRHWSSIELEERLRRSDVLPVLSRQLIVMSRIAWKKHRYLQVSLLGTVFGALLVAIAGLLGN